MTAARNRAQGEKTDALIVADNGAIGRIGIRILGRARLRAVPNVRFAWNNFQWARYCYTHQPVRSYGTADRNRCYGRDGNGPDVNQR